VQEALDTRETQAVGGGGAPSGSVVIRSVMSRSLRRSHRLRGRFALGLGGTGRAGERRGVAKPQVSSLPRVRVSGKYLHIWMPRSLTWALSSVDVRFPARRRAGVLASDALGLGRADSRMTRLAISSTCSAVPGSLADGQGDAARARSGFPSVRLDGLLDRPFRASSRHASPQDQPLGEPEFGFRLAQSRRTRRAIVIDPRREAVLIADRGTGQFGDRTRDVARYQTQTVGGTIDIVFNGDPRVFSYGSERVRILRNSERVSLPLGAKVEVRGFIWGSR
jgi:hypothetical protein